MNCENTNHDSNVLSYGFGGGLEKIVLTKDFERGRRDWCEACRTVDKNMVEGTVKEIVMRNINISFNEAMIEIMEGLESGDVDPRIDGEIEELLEKLVSLVVIIHNSNS